MLVAAAVLPHGDFVYDPSLIKDNGKARAQAEALRASAQDTAATILSLDLDCIILITPHGLSVEDDIAAYLGQRGSGYAEIGRDVGDCSVEPYLVPFNDLRLDDAQAKELWKDLEGEGCSITGLTSYGGYEDVPLRYGEIIPLSFFRPPLHKQALLSSKKDIKETPLCVVMSLPNKRYTQGADTGMVEDMVNFGAKLYQSIENKMASKRAAIIVSADLAHTHANAGPYGFSPAAQPFDDYCAEWARTLLGPPLLEEARKLLNDAKSCGYLGLVILHGVLNQRSEGWDCCLHSISHPTYYGMMVASFLQHR